MIVTYKAAKKLANLGYNEYTPSAYFRVKSLGMANDIPKEAIIKDTYQAPIASDALQWIREKENIECAVNIDVHDNTDAGIVGKKRYRGLAILSVGCFIKTPWYNTYPDAESALLDAVLFYLEKK